MNKTSFTGLMAKTCAAAIVAAAFAMTLPAVAQAQDAAPAAQNTPAPKILVIDRTLILRASKVGQDIAKQVKAYTDAADKEFKGESDTLKKEGAALQQQLAILAPDVKKRKIEAFERKQQAFQNKVQERQDEIQRGVMEARKTVEAALSPILQGIMAERGANLLMDRSAVVLGTVDVDVTGLAVQRLNKKLPAVKVDLVKAPKNSSKG